MSRPVKLEPVAWRYRPNHIPADAPWAYCDDHKPGSSFTVEPLFAAPPRSDKANGDWVMVRNAALEEAATVAAQFIDGRLYKPRFPACSYHAGDIAEAIRALSTIADPCGSASCANCGKRRKDHTSPAVPNVGEDKLWQDIATVPKDGRMVLLYNIAHDEQKVMGWSVGFDDETFPEGCWTNAGSKNQAISVVANGGYFQFWRPLPSVASLVSQEAWE